MTKINSFENIKAWKGARHLIKEVYRITNNDDFSKDYGLKDQIRRASVSVLSNIAEGFSRQTDKEFVQFLYVAKGSVSEVQAQLYVANDMDYITSDEFNVLYNQAEEVAKMIAGFIRYLKKGEDS